MDLTLFRQLVDTRQPLIPSDDASKMYDYVGLPYDLGFSTSAVSNRLYQIISNAFISASHDIRTICRNLEKQLIYEYELDGQSLDPYFKVLFHLSDALNTPSSNEQSSHDNWEQAIQGALDHTLVSQMGDGLNFFSQEFVVARAAKSLQRKGYALIRDGAKIFLEAKAEERLVLTLEHLIQSIGGVNVARGIFRVLASTYSQRQERYHFNIDTGSLYRTPPPHVPYGYLLMLAVKHPIGKKPYRRTEEVWKELFALATDYAALHEVQRFNSMPQFNVLPDMLTEKLRELAIFDVLFRLPQARPRDVIDIIKGVLSEYDFDELHDNDWTINQYLATTEFLLQRAPDTRGPVAFTMSEVKNGCAEVPAKVIDALIENVLSHPKSGANQKFWRPIDAPYLDPEARAVGYDFYNKPLIRTCPQSLVLMDRSLCAPNFLEALFTSLREKEGKDFDDKLGSRIEQYLQRKFAEHGISCLTGNYTVNGANGECDVVVQTDEVIFFIEVKKKALTRDARSGSDVHLLIDLAESLLHAQAQAGWHEVRLRTEKYLDLECNGQTTRLELGDRKIERLAVSLLDFGGLQDRLGTTTILNASLPAAYSLRPGAPHVSKKRFAEMNQTLDELRELTNALHKDDENHRPFMNCWFLSVPQLLMILDGVSSAEDFQRSLWATKFVVMSAQDFYFELEQGWQRQDHSKMSPDQ